MMNSFTATAPIRVAAFPKPYLRLAVRSYTNVAATTGLRNAPLAANKVQQQTHGKRVISSTPNKTQEYFPPPKASHIQEVDSSWSHPV